MGYWFLCYFLSRIGSRKKVAGWEFRPVWITVPKSYQYHIHYNDLRLMGVEGVFLCRFADFCFTVVNAETNPDRFGVVSSKSDDNSLAPQVLQAISYRGVENPFGHCWALTDGAKCLIQSAVAGNISEFYVCDNKENWSSNGIENYELRGLLPRHEGYVKEVILGEFGEIMPLNIGASSTTNFCDCFYTNIPRCGVSERVLLFGAHAPDGAVAGFVCTYTNWTASSANAHVGSRFCFIP